jgi:predicted nucleic acid-binding protein
MSAERQRYLDASAIVKLIVREPESEALDGWLGGGRHGIVSCALVRTEVVRAAAPRGPEAILRARRLLDRLDLIVLDDELLDLAVELVEPLRSLDAIHVAAALELGEELDAFVTYDRQMTRAAEALGLPVVAPA